ncbi:SRPBCC domain-containing protein [Martelella soudanensis]|uniref:SRPBCC domain-containing protein n=1 Tax=unclassified Martelella TaxID=2629616 RepID=UPI0015DDA8EC|nr:MULTISPECIES: SRPBCC domain-containing protein [unclassified Martelella]
MAGFYAARDRVIPPLPWPTFAPPFSALTMVMSDGRKARATFEPAGGKTKVTTTFDAEEQNSIDMRRDGWQAILNDFKRHVEAKPGHGRVGGRRRPEPRCP